MAEYEVPAQNLAALVRERERKSLVVEAAKDLSGDGHVRVCRENIHVWRGVCELCERLEAFGLERVVGSDEDRVVALGGGDARVHRGRGASMLIAEVTHAVAERGDGLPKLVGRAVVADDDLQRRESLAQDR